MREGRRRKEQGKRGGSRDDREERELRGRRNKGSRGKEGRSICGNVTCYDSVILISHLSRFSTPLTSSPFLL